MSDNIIKFQRKVYGENFDFHGDSPKGTFQNDTLTQHIRFKNLIDGIAPYVGEYTSIHDIGSGICDIYPFLEQYFGFRVNYSGTEIVEEMNALARKKYPELELFNRDILQLDEIELYDFVILSGTLNIPHGIDSELWGEFVFDLIYKMFSISKNGIAFNFLTTYKTKTNPDLFYLDPTQVYDFCQKKLSRFVSINSDYPLYECTVTVFKKDFIKRHNKSIQLQKYFV